MDPFYNVRIGNVEFLRDVSLEILLNSRDENDDSLFSNAVMCNDLNCAKLIYERCPSLLYCETSKHGWNALHHAAAREKPEILKFLINADIESRGRGAKKRLTRMLDNESRTALFIAVLNNKTEAVKLLNASDPDFQHPPANDSGLTPLMCCMSDSSKQEMFKLLLEIAPIQSNDKRNFDYDKRKAGVRGVTDQDEEKKQNMYPFYNVRIGNVEFFKNVSLEILLNSRDEKDDSLFSKAVMCNDLNCAKVIYERCPSLLYCETRNDGWNALHHAAAREKPEILEFLIDADAKSQGRGAKKRLTRMLDNEGRTALFIAVLNNRTEAMKLLNAADPDFHHPPNNSGHTPLMCCMSDSSKQEMFKRLLEIAPIQSKARMRSNGWSTLHYAASKGDLSSVTYILRFCPDCSEVVDYAGQNFLHIAAKFEHIEVVRLCVVETKEIATNVLNGQDNDGNTPLNIAALSGNETITLCLLSDPRVNIKLAAVTRHLQWAVRKQNIEIMKILIGADPGFFRGIEKDVLLNSRDGNGESILSTAVQENNLYWCKEICNRCPSLIYHQSRNGKTPLHHAARRGDPKMVKFLISVGAETNFVNKEDIESKVEINPNTKLLIMVDELGDTALHNAVMNHKLEAVKLLIETDPNIVYSANHSGETPLSIAIREARSHENRLHTDHQYKLGLSERPDFDKRTPLQLALEYEDQEMIKLLTERIDLDLEHGANTIGNMSLLIATTQAEEALHTGDNSNSSDMKFKSDISVASKHKMFTLVDVSKHNNSNDCWLVINDKVYDVTNFLEIHPGGDKVLLKATGKDATNDFKLVHSHSSTAMAMMDKFYVGVYDSITSLLTKLASDKPQPYSYEQLVDFTEDFSHSLGSGGFGDVYKGKLPNGVLIAIKVLKDIPGKEKIMEKQFAAEVDTMGRTYHRNLIRLYGYCYDTNPRFKALLYDYMENGSFDTVLFQKKLDLQWEQLHNIAKEIAQGISYLHESCFPQIIHQDIKPANVLLDSNLSPKVIDFGLAKVNMGESQFEESKVKGTRNYMAPEVNQLDKVRLSFKCDVYSFGMILFDILGSKRNHVDNRFWFPAQVLEKFNSIQLEKFILECGIKEEDKDNAMRLSEVALLCVEHNPVARPTMSTVVKMLEGKIKLDIPVTPFYPNYYSPSDTSDSRDA